MGLTHILGSGTVSQEFANFTLEDLYRCRDILTETIAQPALPSPPPQTQKSIERPFDEKEVIFNKVKELVELELLDEELHTYLEKRGIDNRERREEIIDQAKYEARLKKEKHL